VGGGVWCGSRIWGAAAFGGGSAGPPKPGRQRVTPRDAEGTRGSDPVHLWLQDWAIDGFWSFTVKAKSHLNRKGVEEAGFHQAAAGSL